MTTNLQIKRIMHRNMMYRRNSVWWSAMRWLERVQKVPRIPIARMYDGQCREIHASKHRSYPARMYRKLLRLPPLEKEDC